MAQAGKSVRKREKALKAAGDEGAFMESLEGKKKAAAAAKKAKLSKPVDPEVKKEDQEDDQPEESSWKILRNDFMMGAKMKDWDKSSDEDDEQQNEGEVVDDDSD